MVVVSKMTHPQWMITTEINAISQCCQSLQQLKKHKEEVVCSSQENHNIKLIIVKSKYKFRNFYIFIYLDKSNYE